MTTVGPTVALPSTTKPFGEALAELLRENDYTTSSGNIKLLAFARELKDVHYETLRKAQAGEREPSMHLMDEVAQALRISPTYFVEYRLELQRKQFDPREVGFEQALRNLNAWERDPKRKR